MIPIALFGEQHELLQDWLNTDLHCMNIVHAGAGKTFLASIALPIFATDERYHKGKDVIYSAPTLQMVKSLIWEPLKKICREYYGLEDKTHINNSDMTIKFPNGVFIRMKSAEQGDNIRGLNAGIWLADEAALYSSEVLAEISVRLRPKVGQPDTAGRMIIISTPKGANALYDLYNFAKNSPKWVVRHLDYLKMRSGNREYIEEQKRILSPLKFAQDFLCSFENVENQFFYTFDKHKHTSEDIVDRWGDLYSFHDWNKKRMCAIIAQVKNSGMDTGTIEVLKSYAISDCSTDDIARAIRADYPQRNILSIIDMSGAQTNRDTTSPFGTTDKTIMEKYGFRIVNNRKGNPLIADTDNSSNAFIQRGGLIIPHDDTTLIEAMQTYHYEDGTRKKLVKYPEAKYMHIDGLGDALRYGIHHLFGLKHTVEHLPNHRTDDPRFNHQPGSEYLKPSPLYPGGPSWEEIMAGDRAEQDHAYY